MCEDVESVAVVVHWRSRTSRAQVELRRLGLEGRLGPGQEGGHRRQARRSEECADRVVLGVRRRCGGGRGTARRRAALSTRALKDVHGRRVGAAVAGAALVASAPSGAIHTIGIHTIGKETTHKVSKPRGL